MVEIGINSALILYHKLRKRDVIRNFYFQNTYENSVFLKLKIVVQCNQKETKESFQITPSDHLDKNIHSSSYVH